MGNKFKVGDIVQLKSGGPRMTVTAVPRTDDAHYHVRWFAGSKSETASIPADALMIPEDRPGETGAKK